MCEQVTIYRQSVFMLSNLEMPLYFLSAHLFIHTRFNPAYASLAINYQVYSCKHFYAIMIAD